ncbi:MAG: DUF5723 family protein [Saprospiraceae bacterium]
MNNNPTFKNNGLITLCKGIGLAFLVFLVGTTTLEAQRNLNFYNFSNVMQRSHMNPSFIPEAKLTIAVPGLSSIGFGVSNNGFSYRQAGVKNAITGSRKLDFEMALGSIAENNFISFDGGVEILGVGLRLGKHFFYGSLSDHVETSIHYPYGAIDILADDQNDVISQGGIYDFSELMFQSSHYRSMALAYAREMNEKLNLGVRVKLLAGLENIYSKNNGLIFSSFEAGSGSNPDPAYYTVENNIQVMGAGLHRFRHGKPFPLFVEGNYGISVDLGGQYKINEDLEVSASVNNLGFLKWNSELTSAEIGDPMIDVDQLDDFLTDYLDQVVTDVTTAADSKLPAYKTSLNADVYAGLRYQVLPEQFFGVVANPRFYKNKVDLGASFSYHMKVLNWLNAGVAYSIYNNTYVNLGLGLAIKLGPVQGYFSTDNVLGFIAPATAHAANAKMGLNIALGKVKEEDPIAKEEEENKMKALEDQMEDDMLMVESDTVQTGRPQDFKGYFAFQGTTKSATTEKLIEAAYVDIYKINADGFRELIHTSRYPFGQFEIVLFTQPGTHEMHVENFGYQKEIYQFRATETTIRKDFFMIPKPILDSPARPVAVNTRPTFEEDAYDVVPPTEADEFENQPVEGSVEQAKGIFVLTQRTSLRAEANSTSTVQQRIEIGEQVLLLEETDKFWWKVKLGEKTGWVKAALLTPGQ